MNKNLRSLCLTILATVALVAVAPTAWAQQAIRIGTSSVGSTFYTIAIGAGEIVQKHAGLNATVEPVGGSSANMRGLAAKKIEFAIANSFAAFTAFKGTSTVGQGILLSGHGCEGGFGTLLKVVSKIER